MKQTFLINVVEDFIMLGLFSTIITLALDRGYVMFFFLIVASIVFAFIYNVIGLFFHVQHE